MTPFSWRPMNFPFRKNSPPCRIPSNSRKIFLPALTAGSRNLFRYHATPVGKSWMLTLKAESSFQACGSVTFFQTESSKAGASAPFGSPTKSFQPRLKLYFVRALRGGSIGLVVPAKGEKQKSASINPIRITIRVDKRFTQPLNPAFLNYNRRICVFQSGLGVRRFTLG